MSTTYDSIYIQFKGFFSPFFTRVSDGTSIKVPRLYKARATDF